MAIETIRIHLNYSSIGEATDEETTAFWRRYAEALRSTLEAEYPDADVTVRYDDTTTGVTPDDLVIGANQEEESDATDSIRVLSERLFGETLATAATA